MKVTVVHTAFEDAPRIVAEVNAPQAKVEEALEYAYRWTNNVMGSWSIKREMISEDYANGDLNEMAVGEAASCADDSVAAAVGDIPGIAAVEVPIQPSAFAHHGR